MSEEETPKHKGSLMGSRWFWIITTIIFAGLSAWLMFGRLGAADVVTIEKEMTPGGLYVVRDTEAKSQGRIGGAGTIIEKSLILQPLPKTVKVRVALDHEEDIGDCLTVKRGDKGSRLAPADCPDLRMKPPAEEEPAEEVEATP